MGQIRNEILLNKIALTLKKLREAKGLTLVQVYDDTGIHAARIESAKSNISISTLEALCKYYEISLVEFFKKISK